MIRIFAVSGFKNSGKTTLCMKLLEELGRLGVKTGYIKRTAEEALSPRATDTGRAAELGVSSALWGADGLRMESPAASVTPDYIVSRYFPDAEIVIVEGGKYLDLPKIWVENGEPRPENVSGVFMVYDRNSAGDGKMLFGAGCEAEMARRLAATVRGGFYRSAKVYIGDRPLPVKDFIADFIRGSVLGMLASLKGGGDASEGVRIYIDGKIRK